MFGKIIILATFTLTAARPSDEQARRSLWEPSELCPPTHNHFLLPHEWDCTKYYYCEYGMKYIAYSSCAPGTVFSTQTQVCVHPREYNCELPGYPPTDAPTPAPTLAPTQPPATEPPATKPPATEPPATEPPATEPPATDPPATEPPATEPPATEPPATEPPATEPPATEPPATEPPATEPPATDPPATEPPATEPPATEPPATEPPATEPPATEPPATDPPATEPPATEPPATEPPATEPPATEPPATEPPATEPPATEPPATEPPATEAPTQPPGILPNGCPADFTIHRLLPHEECNKFYYCVFGETVERQCAPGTYFNYKIQVCDWPHNVECASPGGSGESGGGENGGGENGGGESGGGENGGGESGGGEDGGDENSTGEVDNSGFLENGCPANFSVHHLLPHETACNKFYYCVSGEKVERECASGTHFNPATQDCDWPENVGCINGGGDGGDETGSGDNGSGDNGNGDVEILPNGCPADWDIHHLLPHETDCNKFYYCVFGEKVEKQCTPGTHFNPATQDCDWPENVGCVNGGGDGGDENGSGDNGSGDNGSGDNGNGDNGNGDNGSGDNGSGDNGSGDNGEGEILPNGCPADWDIHHLLPHETDCNKFYYCVSGEKVEKQCTSGTYFNPATQACDWPENVECASSGGGNGGGESGGGENGGGENGGGENGGDENSTGEVDNSGFLENGCPANFSVHHLLPHETACNKFYYCVSGEKVERECVSGTHFNPATQLCDWPANVGCANGSGEDGGGGNGGDENPGPETLPNGCPADGDIQHLLPHADCDKFYSCVHGNKVEMSCTPGTHFNPSIQACDWPANAGCAAGGGSGENGGGENGGGENGGGENGGGEDGGEDDGETDNDRCKNNCNVLPWAHDTDCDKFWRCDGEKTVLVVCSEGLHFNPSTSTCDFICNAGCVREEAQATMSASGIKLFLPWDKVDSEMERLIELSTHQARNRLIV